MNYADRIRKIAEAASQENEYDYDYLDRMDDQLYRRAKAVDRELGHIAAVIDMKKLSIEDDDRNELRRYKDKLGYGIQKAWHDNAGYRNMAQQVLTIYSILKRIESFLKKLEPRLVSKCFPLITTYEDLYKELRNKHPDDFKEVEEHWQSNKYSP